MLIFETFSWFFNTTIQDYFAHLIPVGISWNELKNQKIKNEYFYGTITRANETLLPKKNGSFFNEILEDDNNVLNWRFKSAEQITNLIFKHYPKYKITKVSSVSMPEIYSYSLKRKEWNTNKSKYLNYLKKYKKGTHIYKRLYYRFKYWDITSNKIKISLSFNKV